MKRLTLLLLVLFQIFNLFAQNKRYYCEIKGTEKDFSTGLKIVFDFGNNPIYSDWSVLKSKQKLVNEQGEEIPFNSMVDAGNYMSDKGWSFQQAYTSFYGGNSIVHWIFYKDAPSAKSAIEGILTKEEYKNQQRSTKESE